MREVVLYLVLQYVHRELIVFNFKDIDIYVGGLAERPPLMPGRRSLRRQRTASVLGTTHAWIIADTFAKLKRADR